MSETKEASLSTPCHPGLSGDTERLLLSSVALARCFLPNKAHPTDCREQNTRFASFAARDGPLVVEKYWLSASRLGSQRGAAQVVVGRPCILRQKGRHRGLAFSRRAVCINRMAQLSWATGLWAAVACWRLAAVAALPSQAFQQGSLLSVAPWLELPSRGPVDSEGSPPAWNVFAVLID